jgi:hypothetical protein
MATFVDSLAGADALALLSLIFSESLPCNFVMVLFSCHGAEAKVTAWLRHGVSTIANTPAIAGEAA